MKIYLKTDVEADFTSVVNRFDRHLFEQLKPPFMHLEILRFDGCKTGDLVELKIGLGPVKQKWFSKITEDQMNTNSWYFTDEGYILPFPLKTWQHHHVVNQNTSGTEIIDEIHFSTNYRLVDLLIYPFMYFIFRSRKRVYKRFFQKS